MACINKEVVFLMIATAFILPLTASATDYIVGNDSGWNLNVDYTEWVNGKTFKVGDTIAFNYNSPHNVASVDGMSFNMCTVPANPMTWNSGHDVITLKAPGKKWYICTVSGHCAKGMKLALTVADSADGPGVYSPTSSGSSVRAVIAPYQIVMAVVAAVAMAIKF